MYSEFKVIDIGHKGYSIDKALVELEVAVSDCIFSEKTRVIKIIHGHGTGALKKGVREWCGFQDLDRLENRNLPSCLQRLD